MPKSFYHSGKQIALNFSSSSKLQAFFVTTSRARHWRKFFMLCIIYKLTRLKRLPLIFITICFAVFNSVTLYISIVSNNTTGQTTLKQVSLLKLLKISITFLYKSFSCLINIISIALVFALVTLLTQISFILLAISNQKHHYYSSIVLEHKLALVMAIQQFLGLALVLINTC